MNYVCVVGLRGVGKDTFATMLQAHFTRMGFDCELKALAEPIKDTMIHMLECDSDIFYDPAKKEVPQNALYGRTPREVMQQFGTEFCQKMFSETIWTDILIRRMENIVSESCTDICIVTDVRFPHELHAFREKNAKIVFIDKEMTCFDCKPKNWFDKIKMKFSKTPAKHASEQGLRKLCEFGDVGIHNDGSLEELNEEASRFAESVSIDYVESMFARKDKRKQASLEWLADLRKK